MIVYIETSAVLSWLLSESQALKVVKVLNKSNQVLTSELTVMETGRSLARLKALKIITDKNEKELRLLFLSIVNGWDILPISNKIINRVGEVFPLEPVRTLDAIHLATILEIQNLYPDVNVLSFDERVIANFKIMGQVVI